MAVHLVHVRLVDEPLREAHVRVGYPGSPVAAPVQRYQHQITVRTLTGDRVRVEMSPYDIDKGRINFRHKAEGTSSPGPQRQGFRRR